VTLPLTACSSSVYAFLSVNDILAAPPSTNDQLLIDPTKFLPAERDPSCSSKLLLPIYCVPPPSVDNEPDFTSTLLTPNPSLILNPGKRASSSTVLSRFFNEPVLIVKPPIFPPSKSAFDPDISPDDFNTKPLELICVADSVKPPILPPIRST